MTRNPSITEEMARDFLPFIDRNKCRKIVWQVLVTKIADPVGHIFLRVDEDIEDILVIELSQRFD